MVVNQCRELTKRLIAATKVDKEIFLLLMDVNLIFCVGTRWPNISSEEGMKANRFDQQKKFSFVS